MAAEPTITTIASLAAPRRSARFARTLCRASSSAASVSAINSMLITPLRIVCDSDRAAGAIRVGTDHGPSRNIAVGRPR